MRGAEGGGAVRGCGRAESRSGGHGAVHAYKRSGEVWVAGARPLAAGPSATLRPVSSLASGCFVFVVA